MDGAVIQVKNQNTIHAPGPGQRGNNRPHKCRYTAAVQHRRRGAPPCASAARNFACAKECGFQFQSQKIAPITEPDSLELVILIISKIFS